MCHESIVMSMHDYVYYSKCLIRKRTSTFQLIIDYLTSISRLIQCATMSANLGPWPSA